MTTTFQYTGPAPQAILRDPQGVFPDILVKKGESFTTDDQRVVRLARELPEFEEASKKKPDGKS